jgi:hypothetical protein
MSGRVAGARMQSSVADLADPRRPVAAAARHGSYASAPPRKSSDPRLSAAPMAPLPLHAAYHTRPPPRDRRFTLSPLHASFALCRLAIRAPPSPPMPAAQRPRRWPEDVAARVGLEPPVSPKRGRDGRIGHRVEGMDGGGCDLDEGGWPRE